jgi:hypothetical protein
MFGLFICGFISTDFTDAIRLLGWGGFIYTVPSESIHTP